jgi:hypothetical protein
MSDASANTNPARQVDELSFYGRLRFTPISDAVRGELSARLSVAFSIDAANLPSPLPRTVMNVARRTRLWHRERLEVARELIAHFQDGLDAGASADQLVHDFGDIDRAAKLIRRAKQRHRPLIWKAGVRSVQALALLPLIVVLLYIPIAIRYFTGAPLISHDYLADLNRVAAAVPQHERAWPLYRQALMGMQSPLEVVDVEGPQSPTHPAGVKPGDEHWSAYERYALENADRVALIRRAAGLPGFGFIASRQVSKDDAALWPHLAAAPPQQSTPLHGVAIPYLIEMRKLAYLLVLDARRAAAAGEADVVLQNIHALLGIVRHTRETPLVIGDLVTMAILQMTFDRIGEFLAQQPQLFSENQLRDLAHDLATITDDDIRTRFDGERLSFYDFVQHAYTDNGSGDGRFTPDGMRLFDLVTSATGIPNVGDPIRETMTPLVGAAILSRSELLDEYERMMSALERYAAVPLWQRGPSPILATIEAWEAQPLGRIRRLPLILLIPAVESATLQPHYVRASRDAMLTAIAMELHRRRHGQWPNTLDELVPSLLPAAPVDRFDGRLLRYRIVDGSPVLYSIGHDFEDDGGMPGRRKQDGMYDDNEARKWWPRDQVTRLQAAQGGPFLDGDWILWRGARQGPN